MSAFIVHCSNLSWNTTDDGLRKVRSRGSVLALPLNVVCVSNIGVRPVRYSRRCALYLIFFFPFLFSFSSINMHRSAVFLRSMYKIFEFSRG